MVHTILKIYSILYNICEVIYLNTIIVDYRTSDKEMCILENLNLNILKCPKYPNIYDAINGHPDIQIFISNNYAIVHNDMNKSFIDELLSLNINVIISENKLTNKYPGNISLNAVILKNYFIHNLRYSDKTIFQFTNSKKLINVKQGYTKCSTAVLNDHAIITSDPSIYKTVKENNIDVLFIPPGDIELPGLNYGFIGGTCGIIDENKMAFFGNLKYYKYGQEVISFLKKHNITPIYLRDDKLIDRGSILRITPTY